MIDEGYTKYHVDWREGPPPDPAAIAALNECRNRLHAARIIRKEAAFRRPLSRDTICLTAYCISSRATASWMSEK